MLSYATEALPGGSLLCDLSCLAGCYACGVAAAMGGCGDNGAGGAHALYTAPVAAYILHQESPACLGRCARSGGQEGRHHVLHVRGAWATGGVGGAGLKRLRRSPPLLMLATPVAIQCAWKRDHGVLPFLPSGWCCWVACVARACS